MAFLYTRSPLLYTTDNGSNYEPMPLGRFTACYNLGASATEVAISQGLQMKVGCADAQASETVDADAQVGWYHKEHNAPARQGRRYVPYVDLQHVPADVGVTFPTTWTRAASKPRTSQNRTARAYVDPLPRPFRA